MQRKKNLGRALAPRANKGRPHPTHGTVRPAGVIRVISGEWRGRKLPVLDVDGLRPTTDRVKETLFNWLLRDIPQRRCLDAFAGSGGLGIEALSRGAKSVTFVELNRRAATTISDNLALLKIMPERAIVAHDDIAQFLQTAANSAMQYDLVFLDPPFHQGLLQPCVKYLDELGLLADHALIYLEMEASLEALELPATWQLRKQQASRQMCYQLWQHHARPAQ